MAGKYEKQKLYYPSLVKELKSSGPRSLYLLWGPEDYLIADFVDQVRSACIGDGEADFNVKRLDGPVVDASEMEDALNAMPFFGGRTFLELHGFDVNRCRDEKIPKLLSDIPEWCTVVITLPDGVSPDGRLSFVKQLKKDGKAVEFTAQEAGDLYKWMARRFAFHGKTADREAMDRLMFLSGNLMNQLIPEIDKICAYAGSDRVMVRDVDAVAHHIPEADAFQMTERIAEGDFDGAAHFLSELLAGDREPMEILGTIGWQMRQLYGAKIAQTVGGGPLFAKEVLGITNDYRLRRLMQTADKFSLSELTEDLRLVAESCMKTREQGASLSEEDALKELLIRFAMENRHASP